MILFDVVECDFPPTLIFYFHTMSSSCVRHAPLSISTSTGFSDSVPFGEKQQQNNTRRLAFSSTFVLICAVVLYVKKKSAKVTNNQFTGQVFVVVVL